MEELSYNKEKDLGKMPKSISLEQMDIIKEQMEKSVCKIHCIDGGTGTGFFCKIPFSNEFNLVPILVTNEHVIKEKDIKPGNKIKLSLKMENLFLR